MGTHFRSSVPIFDNWWFWVRKTNTFLYLISHQDNIVKIYLYAKDLSEPKYQFWIKKREDDGIKHFNDPNAFIECSNSMDDVYENIDDYNQNYLVYWLLKSSCFELSGDGKYGLFWVKRLMERWYLLITGKFLLWTFRRWAMQSFLSQKLDGKMVFTDYWKVLVLDLGKFLFWTFRS